MTPGYIHYRSSLVHYLHAGKSGNVFICFHGYGENASSFDLLQNAVGETQTLICIDLPYHGATSWKEMEPFSINDLCDIVENIFASLDLRVKKFSLIGYSMGGRVALAFTEKYPSHIDKLILLAPDGLKVNFWYRLATQTSIGNRLFKFTMEKPQWFMWMLKLGNRLNIINPSIFKFTHHYIDNSRVRKELYERWTGMRKIKPDLRQIKQQINSSGIRLFMLFGKHDRIILPVNGERFARGIQHCQLKILPCGHRLLEQKNIPVIVQIMES